MFCRRQLLESGARHERGDPTVAIWRKSLNVRTPMGNRRALTVAAIKPPLSEGREILRCENLNPGSGPRPGTGTQESSPKTLL